MENCINQSDREQVQVRLEHADDDEHYSNEEYSLFFCI